MVVVSLTNGDVGRPIVGIHRFHIGRVRCRAPVPYHPVGRDRTVVRDTRATGCR